MYTEEKRREEKRREGRERKGILLHSTIHCALLYDTTLRSNWRHDSDLNMLNVRSVDFLNSSCRTRVRAPITVPFWINWGKEKKKKKNKKKIKKNNRGSEMRKEVKGKVRPRYSCRNAANICTCSRFMTTLHSFLIMFVPFICRSKPSLSLSLSFSLLLAVVATWEDTTSHVRACREVKKLGWERSVPEIPCVPHHK